MTKTHVCHFFAGERDRVNESDRVSLFGYKGRERKYGRG